MGVYSEDDFIDGPAAKPTASPGVYTDADFADAAPVMAPQKSVDELLGGDSSSLAAKRGKLLEGGLSHLIPFGDVLSAAPVAAADYISHAITGGEGGGLTLRSAYDQHLQQAQDWRKAFEERAWLSPTAHAFEDIGPKLLQPIPSFAESGRLARIGGNALTGAALSATNAAGDSDGSISDRLTAGAKVAPLGGLLGGGIASAFEVPAALASAGRMMMRPFRDPEGLAASIIANEAKNPAALLQASQDAQAAKASGDALAEYPTLAERVNAAGGKPNIPLAELETSVASSPAASSILSQNAVDREGARQSMLGELAPNIPPEVAGGLAKQTMGMLQDDLRNQASAQFESIDPKLEMDLAPAHKSTQDAIAKIFGDRVKPSSRITSLLNELEPKIPEGMTGQQKQILEGYLQAGGQLPNTINYGDLQPLRSKALQLARDFADGSSPDMQNATIASHIADQLDQTMNRAGTAGEIPQSAYDTWKEARANWQNMIENGKNPVGKILESENVPPSAVFSKILSTKAGRGQTEIVQNFDNLFGDNPQMSSLLQASAAQDLVKKAIPSGAGTVSKAKILDWMSANKDLLDYLPGLKSTASKVAEDVTNEQAVSDLARMASRRQSMTAQTLAKGNYIQSQVLQQLGVPALLARTMNVGKLGAGGIGTAAGMLAGGPIGGIAGAFGGAAIGGLAQNAEQNVVGAMGRLMANPELYQAAAQRTAPLAVEVAGPESFAVKGAAAALQAKRSNADDRQAPPPATTGTPQFRPGPQGLLGSSPDDTSVFSRAQPEQSVFSVPGSKSGAAPTAIKPLVLDTLATVENSRGKTSPKGAEGTFQLMPEIQDHFGVKDPFDDKQAGEAAWKLYTDELQHFHGDPQLAFAAYNLGRPKLESAIRRAGTSSWSRVSDFVPAETRDYVERAGQVMSRLTRTS